MRTQHHNQRGAPAHHSARKLGGSDEDPAQPKMNKKQDLRKKKTTVWNQEAPTLQERHNQDAPSYVLGFPGGSVVKNLPAMWETWVGSLGPIPGSGRSPGGEPGNPLQYSCLENPMDRGAWWAAVHGVTKSQTRLSD